jgi:hypothetical protein
MVLIKKHSMPAPVQVVRGRFEIWRKSKQGRERIPEPLWASAARLCERYSAHKVSRWLRLNSAALRHRLSGNHSPQSPRGKTPAFVEWVAASPAPTPSAAEYILELEEAPGSIMRLRVHGAHVTQVAQLASLLRGERE